MRGGRGGGRRLSCGLGRWRRLRRRARFQAGWRWRWLGGWSGLLGDLACGQGRPGRNRRGRHHCRAAAATAAAPAAAAPAAFLCCHHHGCRDARDDEERNDAADIEHPLPAPALLASVPRAHFIEFDGEARSSTIATATPEKPRFECRPAHRACARGAATHGAASPPCPPCLAGLGPGCNPRSTARYMLGECQDGLTL